MASNSNRDILPVKDNSFSRNSKGVKNKIDGEILSKLSRCELEEKFLKLLDEQSHLKKLVNCQEEKIKRLGTKLLRIIGEKKNGRKNLEQSEEMQIKIIELEHENYALKDKNIVLKQQLANHSHHSVNQSTIQSIHTSPVTSIKAHEEPHHENTSDSVEKKNVAAEIKLRDAKNVIQELNKEIKALHCKINFLQQEIEKNNIDNRKVKVTENIELIRLQRSLKQQAIQVAALQAQVKNSEVNQKILKEDLIKAHKDNEEALHLISVKQNEILTLCAKLEEKNLTKLEENELRERINDLVLERDSLRERSDFLMKTIKTSNSKDAEKVEELKKLLAEEKLGKKKVELILEETEKKLQKYKESGKEANEFVNCYCRESLKLDGNDSSNSNDEKNGSIKIPIDILQGKYIEEKVNMERELQYLRDMLKMQAAHSESQQKEISRLMLELKVNEEKCNETLGRLDSHLKMFYLLDNKTEEENVILPEKSLERTKDIPESHELRSSNLENASPKYIIKDVISEDKNIEDVSESRNLDNNNTYTYKNTTVLSNEIKTKKSKSSVSVGSIEDKTSKTQNYSKSNIDLSSAQKLLSKSLTPDNIASVSLEKENKINEFDRKKRFVDQVFLESSEEEDIGEEIINDETIRKSSLKLEIPENESKTQGKGKYVSQKQRGSNPWNSSYKMYNYGSGRTSSGSFSSRPLSESSSQFETKQKSFEKKTKDIQPRKSIMSSERKLVTKKETIEITILWLTIDSNSSLLTNKNVKLLFVDFSFLDLIGEETETPNSLLKPKSANEKCNFNFTRGVTITEEKKITLNSLLGKPESNLIVFKVVSEPDSTNEELECEDIGVAVVTAQQFLEKYNNGPFIIPVLSLADPKEHIGKLAVDFQGTY